MKINGVVEKPPCLIGGEVDMEDGYFSINPDIWEDPNLSMKRGKWLGLYLLLRYRSGYGMDVSQKVLGEWSGLNRKTVGKYLKLLTDMKLIKMNKAGNKNTYEFLPYKYKDELCFIDSRDLIVETV